MIRRCESRAYLQHTAQSNGVLSLVLPEQEAKTLQLISNVEFYAVCAKQRRGR